MATSAPVQRLPSPNPKYPFVGPNYQAHGEVQGYLYHPWTDKYYPDPKAQAATAEAQGVGPKKDPSLGSMLLPAAAATAVGAGALEVGKKIPDYISSGYNAVKSGLGYGPDVVKPTVDIATEGASKGAGLLSVGSNTPVSTAAQGASNAVPVATGMDGSTITANPDTFMSPGTDWGAVAQGGAGALNLVNAYQAAKEGNYLGAGIYGATGTANIASSLGSAAGSQASNVLGPVGAAYGAYNTAKTTGDMAAGGRRNSSAAMQGAGAGASLGATIGSIVPGFGTAIGAGIGAVVGGTAGLVGSKFGSSKGGAQTLRDKARKIYEEQGILKKDENGNHVGTLADGSTYNFGEDGKGFGKKYEGHPLSDQAIGMADALASIEGFVGHSRENMNLFYKNAGLSNSGNDLSKLTANFAHFAAQRGITRENAQASLDKLLADNRITQAQHDAWSQIKDRFVGSGASAASTGIRSQTVSPGIRKDGTRIDYSKGKGLLGVGSKK